MAERKWRTVCLLLLLLGLVPLSAQRDIIGEIVFITGRVQLVRNNDAPLQPEIGHQIENLDFLETGEDGLVEIAVYPETGVHASILIRENSVAYMDISALTGHRGSAIELLLGDLEIQVARLDADRQLDIRTGTAVMGVRGTRFTVSLSASGDTFLAASEGRVECITPSGSRLYAIPGEAVVQTGGGRWQNIGIGETDIGDYVRQWRQDRNQELSSRSPMYLRQRALNYLEVKDAYLQSYGRLMNNRAVIQKWMDEDRIGRTGSLSERVQERRQLLGILVDIRSLQFVLERDFMRIARMIDASPAIARDEVLGPGLSYGTFLRQFEQDRQLLRRRMQEVRYIIKLFTLRNDGNSPLDETIREGSFRFPLPPEAQ